MKYLDFMWALEIAYRYHPRCHSNELLILADDIWKWINNELPADSSTLAYLQSCFDNPVQALNMVRKEVQMLISPFMNLN